MPYTEQQLSRYVVTRHRGTAIATATVMTNLNTKALYDSDTNDYLSPEDLDMTDDQYMIAVSESYAQGTAEGHITLESGRRVYAA